MPEAKIQTSFAAGELSPTMFARVDLDKFQIGAALMRNFLVDWRGGASNRQGTKYCGKCKANGARLIPFDFSTTVTYMMEFGNQYIRFLTSGVYVTEPTIAITGITLANPGVLNVINHGYAVGDEIILVTPSMVHLNGRNVIVGTVPDANHFTVNDLFGNPISTLGFAAFVGPGTAARVYTLVSPYLLADIYGLNFVQSADVVTIVHPNYIPYNLSRISASQFTIVADVIGPVMQPPTALVGTAAVAGGYNYGYVVTALSEDGSEESLPTVPVVVSSKILDQTASPAVTVTLHWTAPAGLNVSAYNIYKWGPIDKNTGVPSTIFGYIGQTITTAFTDNNIGADFSKVPEQFSDPFSPGQVELIKVVTGGAGYTGSYIPLTITGSGTGAIAYGIVDYSTGAIAGVWLVENGKNYSSATVTPPSGAATFSSVLTPLTGGFPSVVSYVQQRRTFAAALDDPEGVVFSQTGNYDNFNTSPVVADSDAITLRLASTEVNYIRSMTPMSTGLVMLTSGGAFLMSGGTPGAPITPSNAVATRQASHGANFLPAIVWNYNVMYMQDKANTVRDMAFNFYLQSYVGNDRSLISQHLFTNYEFIQWCAAEEPQKLVWLVRSDGIMLTMTYLPEQEVYGWSHHDTQGLFRSVATVSEGTIDAVYVIVSRYVQPGAACGSGWYDYIERFDDREFDCTEDVWFLDCAVNVAKQFPNFTIYDSGPVGIVGANVEVCAPVTLFPAVPPSVGNPAPATGTVLNYTSPAAPAGGAGVRGNFDWDRGIFYTEQTPAAGEPSYGNLTVYGFNIYTQAIVTGPHADTHLADTGLNSGLTTKSVMGYDGNIYFGTGNSNWLVGRLNTTTWLADTDFPNVTLDAPGDITAVQNAGIQYVVYSSSTSGTVGSRINAIQMTGVTVPVQVGATFTVDEAPGSLSPGNVILCKGPTGRCYGFAIGPFHGVGAMTMGLYAFNVGAPVFNPVKIGVILPSQINGAWTTFNFGSCLYDDTDGNLLIEIVGLTTFLVKINAQTAAVMWQIAITGGVEFKTSRVFGGRFSILDGTGPKNIVVINTIAGTVVSTTAQVLLPTNTFSTSDQEGVIVDQVNSGQRTNWATLGPAPVPNFANVGDVIQIGCGKIKVVTVDNNQEVHGTVVTPVTNTIPNDSSGATLPAAPGQWSVTTPVLTINNLWHLEGKTVMALADGGVVGPFVVTNGSITLPYAATNVVVGLSYQSQLLTLYLDAQGPTTMQGKRKTIPACTARVTDTRGIKIGRNFSDVVEMDELMVMPGQVPMSLVTGDFRAVLFSDWEVTGQIAIQQDYPLPCTILGLIPEFVRGDTGS